MGAAMIGGLLAKQSLPVENIIVSEPFEASRQKISSTFGVHTTTSNAEAAENADVLILAVKPQVAKAVCQDLAGEWKKSGKERFPLVVSICAGIPVGALMSWLSVGEGKGPKVCRVMPNTPALVNEGASGSFAGEGVSEDEKTLVTELLKGFSKASEWVEKEELIDVVTALSGMFSLLPFRTSM